MCRLDIMAFKPIGIAVIRTGNDWYHQVALNYSQLSIDFSVASRYSTFPVDYFVIDEFKPEMFDNFSHVLLIEAGSLLLWGSYQERILPQLQQYEWTHITPTVRVWQPSGVGEQQLTLHESVGYLRSDTQENFLQDHIRVVKNLIDDSNMSYIVHNELPVHGYDPVELDWAITVSSGFFINSVLEYNGFHDNTQVHHMDISRPSLQVRQYTIENWDGENLSDWVDHLNERFPTIKLFNKSHFTKQNKTWKFVWNNTKLQIADWQTHWRRYQNLTHHYHRINIADLSEVQQLFNQQQGQGAIWWDGALKRMPGNLLKTSDMSWEYAKQFLTAIPDNTVCYGGDHCAQQYNGSPVQRARSLAERFNSREGLWKTRGQLH